MALKARESYSGNGEYRSKPTDSRHFGPVFGQGLEVPSGGAGYVWG